MVEHMALTLKQRLFSEYPIPEILSIFGGDGISTFPLVDVDVLIESCIEELASDIYITDFVTIGSYGKFYLPKDAMGVVSAKLDYPFQGNRYVRVSYNASDHSVVTKYFPVVVSYRRKVTVDNVDRLSGDLLIYVKNYILYKMAEKELVTIGSANLNADNGSIDLSHLASFRDSRRDSYLERKQDIMVYTVGV